MIKRVLLLSLLGTALCLTCPAAHAERDAVHFGDNIHVRAGESVHDAVCFFCSVNAEGDVQGNVVVFFGSVHLAGAAHHDVVNFFGSVHADDGASIGQNLVSFFGGIRLGENVSVGHDMVALFGSARTADSVTVGNNRVVQPFWIAGVPVVVLFAILFVIVHELREHRRRRMFGSYPYPPQ